MSKFEVCPICGATLDHGETCDCNDDYNKEETQKVSAKEEQKE
jgi:hypothetical protein